eukprot:COSAG05_NODE_2161_length_3450_cov_41.940931_2_plen_102_part_00
MEGAVKCTYISSFSRLCALSVYIIYNHFLRVPALYHMRMTPPLPVLLLLLIPGAMGERFVRRRRGAGDGADLPPLSQKEAVAAGLALKKSGEEAWALFNER